MGCGFSCARQAFDITHHPPCPIVARWGDAPSPPFFPVVRAAFEPLPTMLFLGKGEHTYGPFHVAKHCTTLTFPSSTLSGEIRAKGRDQHSRLNKVYRHFLKR